MKGGGGRRKEAGVTCRYVELLFIGRRPWDGLYVQDSPEVNTM